MNKKIFSIAITIIIILIIIILITFLTFKIINNKKEVNINDKVENELEFIEKELINMINCLNNISFDNYSLQINKENSVEDKDKEEESDKNKNLKYEMEEKRILNNDQEIIDWNYLKNNSEKLYNIWTTTIIDLKSLNANEDDIIYFSKKLDLVIISSENENKDDLIENLISLYTCIPKFLYQVNSDNKKIQISNTINIILNSYFCINQDNWNEAQKNTQEAQELYMNVINDLEKENKYNKNKTTKINVLLHELNNSITLQDKKLYFIKYKSLIEELLNH